MLNEISSCEVCGEKKLFPALNLGTHPMCDDLVPIGDSRICKEYPIEILFCNTCITAHQRFQIPKHELFPRTYHYRSRHTEDVLNGMESLVHACEKYALPGKKILDIGCNDGSLLNFFAKKNAKTYGIEPTDAYIDARKSRHEVFNDFFCSKTAEKITAAHGQFDIIVFTNVFAHIEDLSELINALKIIMHQNTIIIIENHYLGAIIDKFQFDTFYHEHPRTYSYESFTHIAKKLNRHINNVEFPARYNGNIRITLSPEINISLRSKIKEINIKERLFELSFKEMNNKLISWREQTLSLIKNQIKAHGKLSAKAFPGRAAIPIKLLSLNENHIEAIYEKPTSGKINHYVPGTRIPILSDNYLNIKENASPLLNMAWHISDEIRHYMQARGYTGEIIDIISEEIIKSI